MPSETGHQGRQQALPHDVLLRIFSTFERFQITFTIHLNEDLSDRLDKGSGRKVTPKPIFNRDLERCSLVCRAWCDAARPLLYQDLIFAYTDPRAEQLMATLRSSALLSSYIANLAYFGASYLFDWKSEVMLLKERRWPPDSDPSSTCALELLQMLPNLRQLQLYQYLTAGLLSQMQDAQTFNRLESVALDYSQVAQPILAAVAKSPTVKHIGFRGWGHIQKEDQLFSYYAESLDILQTLVLAHLGPTTLQVLETLTAVSLPALTHSPSLIGNMMICRRVTRLCARSSCQLEQLCNAYRL